MTERTEHPRIWQAITGQPWAIQPDALEQIMLIAERAGNPEALHAKLADPLRNTRTASIRDGVAIIPVMGPLFPRANMFTEISGGASAEIIAQDFRQALADPGVHSIVLDIDSPGGQVAGISELADLIFDARGQMPIVAYISGMGASGAYWIPSAVDEIVLADTALVGSIGVVMAADVSKKAGRVEIVSSRAPLKRADIASDDGRLAIQNLVNRIEDVFIAAVARNRGVDIETVAADFGRGGLLVGADAVAAGMADRVSTFESVIAGLSGRQTRTISMNTQVTKAADQPAITVEYIKAQHPAIAEALISEGADKGKGALAEWGEKAAKAERDRIQSVFTQGQKLPGHGPLIQQLMFDGKTTGPEAAVEILAAEGAARGKTLADIRADAPRPAPTVDATQDNSGQVDPNLPIEERAKAEWDSSPAIRAEFGGEFDSFMSWKRADESGRIQILNVKRA